MAYILPSVLVQQSLSSGGAVTVSPTPDLEACIIGPAYNTIKYSLSNQVTSFAHSSVATTGTAVAGSSAITLANVTGLNIGDTILIKGASSTGSVLQAVISGLTGPVANISPTVIGTSVTNTEVAKSAVLMDSTIANSYSLPGQIVGQVLDTASVQVWMDNVTVETYTSSFFIAPSSNLISPLSLAPNLNSVAGTLNIQKGDTVKFAYTNGVLGTTIFTSKVQSVTTTTGSQNGNITLVALTDTLPGTATGATVAVSVSRVLNNQLITILNPLGLTNYVISTTATDAIVTLNPQMTIIQGTILSGNVYLGYRALRTDLSNRVLTFNNRADLVAQLTDITDTNPLGLASTLALSNTSSRIRAIAISSDNADGYLQAQTVAEGERLYALSPLTQDTSIIASMAAHANSLSTPTNASWRTLLANTAIPTTQFVGAANIKSPSSATSVVTNVGGTYLLTDYAGRFINDGVTPGDAITFVAGTGTLGTFVVNSVISNQQVTVSAITVGTGVSYYITRTLSKGQSATAVASFSQSMASNRVIHIQPDSVGVAINGVVKYLPGYYLCAAVAGMIAGLPIQQGLTNLNVAGISDLRHSNFYFSKADLNVMAGAGTCLFVQDTQGGVPYCRHELTTDMTTLNTREIVKVKEIDYLSYFYSDKLKSFVGRWNITTASLNTLRQTIIAGSELLRSQSLPKLGPVLINYNINTLIQDPVSTDHVQCVISVAVGTPMNYIDLNLVA